jgi:hypothetical protein
MGGERLGLSFYPHPSLAYEAILVLESHVHEAHQRYVEMYPGMEVIKMPHDLCWCPPLILLPDHQQMCWSWLCFTVILFDLFKAHAFIIPSRLPLSYPSITVASAAPEYKIQQRPDLGGAFTLELSSAEELGDILR